MPESETLPPPPWAFLQTCIISKLQLRVFEKSMFALDWLASFFSSAKSHRLPTPWGELTSSETPFPTKITLRCGTQQSYWAVFMDYHPANDPKKLHCRISLFVTSFLLVSKCKGCLPVPREYVIYSPGKAPRANCLRLNFQNREIGQFMWSYQTVVLPERDE